MRILIVDDSIDKITQLTELINNLPRKCIIDNSETISNAISLLRENKYDIAVIDLYLPLRNGETPNPQGGKTLLNELYRKISQFHMPNYIIGFSKYESTPDSFSPIWKVVNYDPSSLIWKSSFEYMFKHILQSRTLTAETATVIPVVFLEGLTDLAYLNVAKVLFFKEYKHLYELKSQSNAGANWVSGQIVIWGMQKAMDESNKYIKAIALLDSDDAGTKAKDTINERLKTPNEKETFKIIQLGPKYNSEIIEFYKQKCKIEIEIENLFPLEVLLHADSMNWLEYRNQTFVLHPSDWQQHLQTSKDYILSKGLSESQLVYTKKVKIGSKRDFCNYVVNLDNKEEVFKNFEPLLKDILHSIGLI